MNVTRDRQGSGRHDNPEHYGALYAARTPESAVAEGIQAFRGRTLTDQHLRRADGRQAAIASIDESQLGTLVDLDDPKELVRRDLRPSSVATSERLATQPIALAVYLEGYPGLSWWSVLEASWTNVTLFAERAVPSLTLARDPEPLSIAHPAVRSASDALGIRLAR